MAYRNVFIANKAIVSIKTITWLLTTAKVYLFHWMT